MPSFWLGLVLIYIFGLKLGLVPIASSRVTPIGVILPAVTLAAVVMGPSTCAKCVSGLFLKKCKGLCYRRRARGVSEM